MLLLRLLLARSLIRLISVASLESFLEEHSTEVNFIQGTTF